MKNIVIICQYAQNKGDRAIAEYLISQLGKCEDIQLTLSTTVPALWENAEKKGVRVVGMGWKTVFGTHKNKLISHIAHNLDVLYYDRFVYPELVSEGTEKKHCRKLSGDFITMVSEADLVIVTGGHHITSIRDKNALFPITYDIALASLYAKKYVLWSQTIGPLSFTDDRVREFFAGIIGRASRVYIRDNNSSECVKELMGTVPKNVYVSYDSVFGFGCENFTPFEERENKVGISIFNGLRKAFDTFGAIAEMLDFFAGRGVEIEFFRMEHNESELEDINKVINLMKNKTAKITVYPFNTTTAEHLRHMSRCKYYIGYKTHSVIMSLTTATPLIGICYHRKTRDFMEDYGLGEYAVDDDGLTGQKAVALAARVMENAEGIHRKMQKRSREIAEQLENDLRTMIADEE